MKPQAKLTVREVIKLLSRVKNKHQAVVYFEQQNEMIVLQFRGGLKVSQI